MYTYKVSFHGMNSEAMVKTMDKIFRRWYNVYGGYRAMTTKDTIDPKAFVNIMESIEILGVGFRALPNE